MGSDEAGVAVRLDRLSGHIWFADHHQHGLGDRFRLVHATERDACRDLVAARPHHAGLNQRGGDCVDGNSVLGETDGATAVQPLHAGLCEVVMRADRAGTAPCPDEM
jgi:hypothetical protein